MVRRSPHTLTDALALLLLCGAGRALAVATAASFFERAFFQYAPPSAATTLNMNRPASDAAPALAAKRPKNELTNDFLEADAELFFSDPRSKPNRMMDSISDGLQDTESLLKRVARKTAEDRNLDRLETILEQRPKSSAMPSRERERRGGRHSSGRTAKVPGWITYENLNIVF